MHNNVLLTAVTKTYHGRSKIIIISLCIWIVMWCFQGAFTNTIPCAPPNKLGAAVHGSRLQCQYSSPEHSTLTKWRPSAVDDGHVLGVPKTTPPGSVIHLKTHQSQYILVSWLQCITRKQNQQMEKDMG